MLRALTKPSERRYVLSPVSSRGIAHHLTQASASLPAQVKQQGVDSSRTVANPPPPHEVSGSAAEHVDSSGSRSAAPASRLEGLSAEEPEYDPDEEYDVPGQADLPEFPITHELILKDHTKVVSALALDPSGARVLSGSHDYDCKLWDFGGMDHRCKPFKSWEPAESYHVGSCHVYDPLIQIDAE
jgi:WD40 repeat protein